MLSAEAAATRIKACLLPHASDDSPPLLAEVAKLPTELRGIGYGILGRDTNGKPFANNDWRTGYLAIRTAILPMDALSETNRRRLFSALCSPLADAMDDTWELLKTAPYQTSYLRRSFRVPTKPEYTFELRRAWLVGFVQGICRIQPEVLTPQWLAIWGSYLGSPAEAGLGQLLAAVMNRGDAVGNEVFEILCQSARNEHEVAGMSRMVSRALLMAERVDGWELMERLLLAAQRQEGLRQVLLETIDEAHPQAFRRMLQIMIDQKLARFSAVTRAVDVWCGLNFESEQLKAVNGAISRAIQYLDDSAVRAKAIASDEPEDVYFGLWATAYHDAFAGIAAAQGPQKHRKPEVRYVAAYFLLQLALPESRVAARALLNDPDLHVALAAFDASTCETPLTTATEPRSDMFERLEQLLHRLPEKPQKLPAFVWPWTERTASRELVAHGLVGALGERPPTRLLAYLPMLHRSQRVNVIRLLAEQKKWDQLTRQTLLELTGHTSPEVREAALEAMSRVELIDSEVIQIEGLLSRKVSDLRIGVIKLLLQQPDPRVLASAGRLLGAKEALMRLGGLELLRQMLEADRERATCILRAQEYASAAKRTEPEQAQIDAMLTAPAVRLTLDDALGLLNPADLSPIPKLTAKPFLFVTDAAVEIIKSLDELVHTHREAQIRYTLGNDAETDELLGAMRALPRPDQNEPIESQRAKLPLAEVWEEWYHNRPSSQRDSDGFELVRAEKLLAMLYGYWWHDVVKWAAKHPDRQRWIGALAGGRAPENLRYERIVDSIVDWLLFLHRPADMEEFLLDAVETCYAMVPQSCHEELLAIAKSGQAPELFYHDDGPTDWRDLYGTKSWPNALENRDWYRDETLQQAERRWRLVCFESQPIAGAIRHRPSLEMALHAYRLGFATLADLTEMLLGPRIHSGWGVLFDELSEMTARTPSSEFRSLLESLPDVVALVDRCRERVLEIELARGDTPTPATAAASSLSCYGVKTLGRILRVLGSSPFQLADRYSIEARMARLPTWTELAKSTYPAEKDTQADFDREIQACLSVGLREAAVLELMFLAPQWSKFVEGYFQWPGLSEGLYWFLAHMKYINADAESAATAGGYEADHSEQERDQRNTRSAWQRLIAERTLLSDEERTNGAIDVAWFHRVYAQLTPKRWEQLAAAARFAANPAQAKRASYLGEVLLGKANKKELFAAATQKKLKESVRLIGLYPLATGTKRATDLAQRYKMLVEYRRYAKGLSGLTKPAAMQSLEIGFRNLASTAGYIDPLRLEWAMEADAVKDLAQGSVSASKDGVIVTLALDEFARPVVTAVKGDKLLKAVPPAIKKDPKVAGILERVAELRRQASRVKESLEVAMCRGDEFEPAELEQLCHHALLKVLLERLVIVADDRAGYPVKGGTALRDHTGKQYAVKKNSRLRIAHPHDLLLRGDWSSWQRECFQTARVQPFKQLFRELYVVTKQEKKDGTRSLRYAGQQVNPQQANALWNTRHWHTQDGVFRAFPSEGITASLSFQYGGFTPLDVEGLTFEAVTFQHRDESKPRKLADVPPRLFSEVMRDLDLVVSVAHRGGVDPEATASTVEMRAALVEETCVLLGLKNVKVKQPRVVIKGQLAEYALHLGSGNIQRMPGNSLCVVPVHAQHRGRLFLPFADEDPRTAEIVSKVLLLAKDQEIQDPSILEQLRS